MSITIRKLALAAVAAAAALPAASASAASVPGVLPVSSWYTDVQCASPTLSSPLTAFGDSRSYVLAPGGDFQSPATSGWQLFNGASIVRGQLAIPPKAIAVSPAMCVDLTYPTARAFVQRVSGDAKAFMSVIYDAGKVAYTAQDIGEVKGRGFETAMVLSDDLQLRPDLAGKAPGWRKVAFVLTGAGNRGTVAVDNLWVDPMMRG